MTELRIEPYEIPAASLGPENPLPVFRSADENGTYTLDASVPTEDRKYMGWHTACRLLPYRVQDGYDRNRRVRAFQAAVLENEHLRATFLPEIGGRLVSLIAKPEGRELLDRNPVFQPANLALRNAWFSGGIEWNAGGMPGHHYLTCSQVFAARVSGPEGNPVLRLYEWERVKCFPWQIDFHLPRDSRCLFAHIRLVNPHDAEIPMYWWTNIAVEEKPRARVIFPADTAIGFCDSGLGLVQLPMVQGRDASYAVNVPFAQEMFSRIDDGQRRWMACLDEKGSGLFEASTDLLRGRKMFCWGMNAGGRRWQEFLSEPGNAYIEIQAGLARTQLECLPMPGHAAWAWTEAFGLLETDPEKVHSRNWTEARQTVDSAIETALPRARMESLHAGFEETAQRAPEEILQRGSGWAALERIRARLHGEKDSISVSTPHEESHAGAEQEPWLTFLKTGEMPPCDTAEDPGPPMIQPEWRALLEEALRNGRCDHWRAWYHLGVMRLEALDENGARDAWQRSIDLAPSGWAYHGLAALARRASDKQRERDYLRRAWETGPKIVPLAIEYAHTITAAKDFDALDGLVKSLPEGIRGHERIRIITAQAALERGRLEEVADLFNHEFATNREGEVTLTDLWFAYHEKRIAAAENIPIDTSLQRRVREQFPPPRRIDFRMVSDIR